MFLNTPLLLLLICFLALPKSWSANLQTSLKVQGDTLNFEVSGQKNWDYDVKRIKDGSNTKVQLQIKGLDEASAKNIKVTPNPFVKSVDVLPKALDGFTVIEFTLASNLVESFDYLTDQPSKLVVDFYKNEEAGNVESGSTNASSINDKPIKKAGTNTPKVTTNTKSGNLRKPADISFLKADNDNGILTFLDQDIDLRSGLFDGGDEKFYRFKIKDIEIQKNAILKGYSNYYLNFPMLNHEFNFWTAMKNNYPDYSIKPNPSEENKQARLLKTLFDKKRHLVLQKATKWFDKKFPNSEYREIVQYMNADSLMALWRETNNTKYFDEATLIYLKLMQDFPDSKLTERTSLLLGMLNLDKKDYLTALRKLSSHVESDKYKGKSSQDYAKIAMAYSLLKVKKLDEAIKLLDEVEQDSKNKFTKAEAAFRKGDFYFHQAKLDDSIIAYEKALKKYPQYGDFFPNAFFNKMEAQFRYRQPESAHASALEFVQRFPAHDFAPYALTRVGELMQVLGAEQSKPVGAFLETQFRYGDNPKTVVARLHLLSTRMKSMKDLELKKTIADMNKLAEQSDLDNIQQFKTTMVADGYFRRKEYANAIDILTQFYQREPNKPDSHQVTNRIVKNINEQIKDYVDKNNFRDVLKTYKKYSDTWLKTNPRIDTNFYVAKAYQAAGSYQTALKKYDKILKQIDALKDDTTSLIIKATQELPTKDTVNLMQAMCMYEDHQYQDAFDTIQKVKKPELLSVNDQISRVHYAALLYEQKGEINAAVRYLTELTKIWNDKKDLLVPSVLHLADLEVKRKNSTTAITHLENLIDSKISEDQKFLVYKKISDIALAEGKNKLALETLNSLINAYSDREGLSSYRFKLGEIYFNQGELKKAENIWAEIKGTDSEFWSQVAQNKLKDAAWREQNNKYLKRIPAMSKSEENVEGAK